jgi:hypothetical protein
MTCFSRSVCAAGAPSSALFSITIRGTEMPAAPTTASARLASSDHCDSQLRREL